MLQLGDEIRRYEWTQLDLNRTLVLVIEQLQRIEMLVSDGDAQPEPEHLVHRWARLAADTSTTANLDRGCAAGKTDTRANSAEIDLRALDALG